ncbi:MAG: DoxX protein [Bacteroidetes bacterium]|nr:DoxX protein [Bacteroidota bacterium]
MKTLSNVLRFLLAIILLVFGLNKVFHFLPMEMGSGPGADFFGALIAAGYMIPVIVAVELIAAFSLMLNRFVSFTMVLLAPISLNILLYGIFLDSMSLPIGGFTFLLNLYFLVINRKVYWEMFKKE